MPTPRKSTSQTTPQYRARMRAKGLREVKLWVYDTSSPAFVREFQRQVREASTAALDADVDAFTDAALADMDDWTA